MIGFAKTLYSNGPSYLLHVERVSRIVSTTRYQGVKCRAIYVRLTRRVACAVFVRRTTQNAFVRDYCRSTYVDRRSFENRVQRTVKYAAIYARPELNRRGNVGTLARASLNEYARRPQSYRPRVQSEWRSGTIRRRRTTNPKSGHWTCVTRDWQSVGGMVAPANSTFLERDWPRERHFESGTSGRHELFRNWSRNDALLLP